MKYKILLLGASLLSVVFSNAQYASKTYAITGKANNNFFWADIKQVDLTTGKINKVFFEADKTTFKNTNLDKSAMARSSEVSNPTGLGVAACAFDTRHNRLYFATMHYSDIRYLDLNGSGTEFTTIKKNAIGTVSAKNGFQPEEAHITRMVIAADGYGYALSNDANHLLRFSTSNNPTVEDLGNLVDGESNNGISIHNKCTSWGGDMVADAFGKLVVVSASHNVFNIDVKNRVASYVGSITGLPANFSTNGAAVDDEGGLVVSSANVFEGLYKVNMKGLAAVKVPSTEQAFNASDLANGNLLLEKEAAAASKFDITNSNIRVATFVKGEAKVFPNPVTASVFNVNLVDQKEGRYTIVFADVAGRTLQTKTVNVIKGNHTEQVNIQNRPAKGVYMVKVLDAQNQIIITEKIVLE